MSYPIFWKNKKIGVDIYCKRFPKETLRMKCHILVFWKKKKKNNNKKKTHKKTTTKKQNNNNNNNNNNNRKKQHVCWNLNSTC